MKRLSFIYLLCVLILVTSFRCTTGTWSFVVAFQFVDATDDHSIDGLHIGFSPKLYNNGYQIEFEPMYKNSASKQDLQGYFAVPCIYSLSEISADDRYLDCSAISDIMNTYGVVVTDPYGIYKDYKSPTLRELLENSNNRDIKLSIVDQNGNTHWQNLAFKIPLEKN